MLKYCVIVGPNPVECPPNMTQIVHPKLFVMFESSRNRRKMKDDAIAQLSDQLVSLSARLQEIERTQLTA